MNPKGGKPRKRLNKRIRNRYCNKMLDLASEILVKQMGRAEFRDVIKERKRRNIKGYGHEARPALELLRA